MILLTKALAGSLPTCLRHLSADRQRQAVEELEAELKTDHRGKQESKGDGYGN